MMNIKNILSIAALALVGAIMTGCSSEDKLGDAQTAGKGNVVTQKITVNLDDGKGTTRALDADGKKTFAVGDKIAIVYTNTSDATVKAESSALTATDITSGGKSAMFTVSLTNPKASAAVTYIYPAAMANADGSVNYAALATQDGTLATLASDLDLASGTGTLSATGALPTTSVALANPLAILALTVKDNGDNDITNTITSLSVGDGTNIYAVNRTAAAGRIYVAIQPTASTDIAINASDGTTNYYKALPSTTFAASNGYSLELTMAQGIHLAALAGNITAKDGDVLTGTLNGATQPYKISIAAPVAPATTTSITLDNAVINGWSDGAASAGVSTVGWAGITPLGNATIILKDGTTNTVTGFYDDYPGIFAAAGSTLTIQGETAGTGTLTASSNGKGAGIGGGDGIACGNIAIQGGTVTATGGTGAAGIGGGNNAACGTITITSNVTSVSATKSTTNPGPNSIGAGDNGGSCGTVTIGGVVTEPITTSPYSYPFVPEGAINSKFSVSLTTKVYFSKGNLQATYNGSEWSWAFAANQWDRIGNAAANNSISGNGTVSANGTVDLFGWVGSNSTFTGVAQYGISNSTTNSDYGTSNLLKADWGATIGTGWRTLTADEWGYLFYTRTTGGTVFGTSEARYTHATINTDATSVNGMILFPDGVDIAVSEVTTPGTVNGNSAWGTKCTSAQWTALAAKGCVFLPVTGRRPGASVQVVDIEGNYWSSSYDDTNNAYAKFISFSENNFYTPFKYDRHNGNSVRLVYNVVLTP